MLPSNDLRRLEERIARNESKIAALTLNVGDEEVDDLIACHERWRSLELRLLKLIVADNEILRAVS